MNDSKRQSVIMIGIGFILLSAILFYFALSQPKVYTVNKTSSVVLQSSGETADYQNIYESQAVTAQNNQSNYSTAASVQAQSGDYTDVFTDNVQTQQTQASKAVSQANVTFPINLNTCTQEDLTAINGIGDTRASAIIEYRDFLGGYSSVDQIKNIKGIGDKLFEKVASYLTV